MSDNNDESMEPAESDKTDPSSQSPGDRRRPPAATEKSIAKNEGKPNQSSTPDNRGKEGRGPGDDRKSKDSDRKESGTQNPSNRKQPANRPAKKRPGSNRQAPGSPQNSSRGGGAAKPTLRQPPVDREELQDKAWALYRADINEEGTSMFNEDEAEDLVRRSFILADIFLRFRDQLYGKGSARGNSNPASESRQEPRA